MCVCVQVFDFSLRAGGHTDQIRHKYTTTILTTISLTADQWPYPSAASVQRCGSVDDTEWIQMASRFLSVSVQFCDVIAVLLLSLCLCWRSVGDGRDKRPRQEVRTELKGQKFDAKWFMNVVSTVGEWLVTWLLVYCCVWKTKKIQKHSLAH